MSGKCQAQIERVIGAMVRMYGDSQGIGAATRNRPDRGALGPSGAGVTATENNALSQGEVNVIKFRNAVAEIFGRCSELMAKQHALRVESDALEIRHAAGHEFGADGAQYPVLLYPGLTWTQCHARKAIGPCAHHGRQALAILVDCA